MSYEYAAGLIDGEGTITLIRLSKKRTRQPHISVSSTTPEIVQYMKTTFGGSVSTKRRKQKQHHKTGFQWSLRDDKALTLLSKVLEFLKEPTKRARAHLLVSEYKAVTKRNGKYSVDELKAKKEFERRFFETGYARQHSIAA